MKTIFLRHSSAPTIPVSASFFFFFCRLQSISRKAEALRCLVAHLLALRL